MRTNLHSLLILSFLLINLVLSNGAENDEEADVKTNEVENISCEQKGFGLVLCSDCDELGQYTHNYDLLEECQVCCTERIDTAKYVRAVLKYNNWILRNHPGLEDFLKSKEIKTFKNLRTTSNSHAKTQLELFTSDGEKKVVNINGWKADLFVEFLEEKLVL